MSPRLLLPLLLACLGLLPAARAFPPAPHHTIYGTVRDPYGRPLTSGEGTIFLNGETAPIAQVPSDPSIAAGVNYTIHVPMDAGTISKLYTVNAMRPLLPFTIKVQIGSTSYVPIQIVGKTWAMGKPGDSTRLDLTLGVDSNDDELPDAWQQALVDADTTGRLKSINDVKPGDDLSGNGLTNLEKFLLGVNALDKLDGVKLDVVNVSGGIVQLRFMAVIGRTYRIRSSTNSTTWIDQAFSADPSGVSPTSIFTAPAMGPVNVYVAWPSATHGYFQLFAQ